MDRTIGDLLRRADLIVARTWLEMNDARTLANQRALAAIPAPTGAEGRRAAFMAEVFTALGLKDVHTDEVGNVHARVSNGDGPGLVIASHLDTVFADDVPHRVTSAGARLHCPSIGDNARGLAAMLTLAEVIGAARVRLPAPITFVATVGEEGAGNLRGVRHLFSTDLPNASNPLAFIALDGPGLDRIVHRATGSIRFRATFTGPGGHSWSAFGIANPAHAVGAAAAAIGALALPAEPRATASVVRLGGGTGLNTIPSEAWLEVDLRAEDAAGLASAHRAALDALERAADQVNRRRVPGTPALELAVTPLGDRPAGLTAEDHPLVRAALAATRALGERQPHLAAASTDANIPISRGVPAIALGAGGKGGDAHTPSEWYENTNGPAGILRALLVALAVSEAPAT